MGALKLFGYSWDTEEFDDRYLKRPGPVLRKVRSDQTPKGKINYKQCCYCWASFKVSVKTRDHIHPKSKGGKLTRPCCYECNQEKADMTMTAYIGFLAKMMAVFEIGSPYWKKYKRKLSNAKKLQIELAQ